MATKNSSNDRITTLIAHTDNFLLFQHVYSCAGHVASLSGQRDLLDRYLADRQFGLIAIKR
jgi:hypothetical protein